MVQPLLLICGVLGLLIAALFLALVLMCMIGVIWDYIDKRIKRRRYGPKS